MRRTRLSRERDVCMSFGRARQPQLPEGRSEYLVGAVDSRSIPAFDDSATGPRMPGRRSGMRAVSSAGALGRDEVRELVLGCFKGGGGERNR
jgi:hypothetical protein